MKTDDDTVLSITRLGKLVNKLEKEEDDKEEENTSGSPGSVV